jgi:hypothetical protein
LNDGPIATSHGPEDDPAADPDNDPPSLETIGDLAPVPIAELAPAPVQALAYETPPDLTRTAEPADRPAAQSTSGKAAAWVGLTLALAGFWFANVGVLIGARLAAERLLAGSFLFSLVGMFVSLLGIRQRGGKIGVAVSLLTLTFLLVVMA